MKRMIIYVAILAVVLWVPVHSADVGQLRPVQLVSFYMENQNFVISTDTGDIGVGVTVAQAFENLEETTPAVIYLDTADFLLVSADVMEYVPQLDVYLKSNVKLCQQEEPLDPALAVEYLAVQKNLPRIKTWNNGGELPVLRRFGERFILC